MQQWNSVSAPAQSSCLGLREYHAHITSKKANAQADRGEARRGEERRGEAGSTDEEWGGKAGSNRAGETNPDFTFLHHLLLYYTSIQTRAPLWHESEGLKSSSKQINPKREEEESFMTCLIPPVPLADPQNKAKNPPVKADVFWMDLMQFPYSCSVNTWCKWVQTAAMYSQTHPQPTTCVGNANTSCQH